MNLQQFRDYITTPTLSHLQLWSPAAENLVVGTVLKESLNFTYIDQTTPGDGPAYGFPQIEGPTHDAIWNWMRKNKPALAGLMHELVAPWPDNLLYQLRTNIAYAIGMCRVRYYMIPEPLPSADDIPGLAHYWKFYYNTMAGKGREVEWTTAYRLAHV